MAGEFFEIVDADTLHHHSVPKVFSRAAMEDRIADLETMLGLSDRKLLVALEGSARFSDINDARSKWTTEKTELERLVGLFSARTETLTIAVVITR